MFLSVHKYYLLNFLVFLCSYFGHSHWFFRQHQVSADVTYCEYLLGFNKLKTAINCFLFHLLDLYPIEVTENPLVSEVPYRIQCYSKKLVFLSLDSPDFG